MKKYVGFRSAPGGDTGSEAVVNVVTGDQAVRLQPTMLATQKSPTGWNWGYGGSGPAALAHSLLADAIDLATADELYQQFKAAVVSQLPQEEDWEITLDQIEQWIAATTVNVPLPIEKATPASVPRMTREQMEDFFQRLEGEEGCNFRENAEGKIIWNCGGGTDKSLSTALLKKMGIPDDEAERFLNSCDNYGGHCDCEILFNAMERMLG